MGPTPRLSRPPPSCSWRSAGLLPWLRPSISCSGDGWARRHTRRLSYTLLGYVRGVDEMAETLTYRVPGMHCGHCKASVEEEVSAVEGVEAVEVDLETKLVVVHGE